MLEKSKIIQLFNNHFPPVTEENIVKRTIFFFGLLYILLFSIPMVMQNISLSTVIIFSVTIFFFITHSLSFIISKKYPSFFRLIDLFSGFKLFMFVYVTFLMFTLLLTVYFPDDTTFLGILYFIGFGIFPVVILFYYISRAIKYAKTKIKDKK